MFEEKMINELLEVEKDGKFMPWVVEDHK